MTRPPDGELPPARAWPRSRLLNVWVDDLSMSQLMSKLDRGMVFTLNPDHLYHLQRNAAFVTAYRKADFITSDSKYVYWGLGWIGRGIQEKVSGSDIVPSYCAHHANNPAVKVFLLGAALVVAGIVVAVAVLQPERQAEEGLAAEAGASGAEPVYSEAG